MIEEIGSRAGIRDQSRRSGVRGVGAQSLRGQSGALGDLAFGKTRVALVVYRSDLASRVFNRDERNLIAPRATKQIISAVTGIGQLNRIPDHLIDLRRV